MRRPTRERLGRWAFRLSVCALMLPGLSQIEAQRINEAVTDAPLRLIQHVIENDRPYSEIVTADYTVADDIVAKVWGLQHDGGENDWRETHYTDGREHAGILSDSFLFTRHSTTYSNANRGRANAVSSSLLCYDFLSRDITIDASIDLADPDEVANATRKNAACASCHQTLDPLAAYFAGFRPQYVPSFEQSYPVVFHTEPLSDVFAKAEPAYFGYAGRGLAFLGGMIAKEPRFSLCAAKRFYSYLNQVPLERVPIERAAHLQRVLVDGGMNARQLARAVVLSDDFRTSHPLDDTVGPQKEIPGFRKVRARELDRIVADLTGFVWQTELGQIGQGGPYDPGRVGRIDLVSDPFFGYAVLFGGTDAYYVTRPSHAMNATASAVLRGIAQHAAPHAVAKDFAVPASRRRLFSKIEATDVSEPAVRAQIAHLHARVYGELPTADSAEVGATYALFRDALDRNGGDAKRAWSITLYAMLQDVRLVFY